MCLTVIKILSQCNKSIKRFHFIMQKYNLVFFSFDFVVKI